MDFNQFDTKSNYRVDSLRKRYIFKLMTNIFGFGISLVAYTIIPRGLGPKSYGDFNFLTNFFTKLIDFFDMGSSFGFYTKLSQRQKEFKLISFYFCFMVIVSLAVIGLVGLAQYSGIYAKLWPDQRLFYICLAVFWGIMNWAVMIANQMTDAYGLTVSAEIGKTCLKTLGLFILIILFIFKILNIQTFFYYNYFSFLTLFLIFTLLIAKKEPSIFHYLKLSFLEIKKYLKEFYRYIHPLFTYSLIALFVGIADRWLLQVFGGSIEQGFFGLSYQIGIVCFLFTSAMTSLIMREFSIAHAKKDFNLMTNLFAQYIPLFYFLTAFLACFIGLNADKVTLIMGGGQFKGATLAVAVMAFYPIHQTYGQLSGSLFYATDQTKLYRNIGVLFMLLGLPVTYFLIAPKNAFGIALGAEGLSIKMVLIQFIAVNVQLYFNTRFLKLSFWRYLGHQVICLGYLSAIAFISIFLINKILNLQQNIIANFISTGVIYSLIVFASVYLFPALFGLKKRDIAWLAEKILKLFSIKRN